MDSYDDRLNPEPGDSSYVRVYKLLMQTPSGQEIRRRVEEAFNTLTFHKHSFVLHGTSAVVRFEFRLGSYEWTHDEGSQFSHYYMSAKRLVTESELERVVKTYLGKPRTGPEKVEHAVPTFNCSMDTVLGKRKKIVGKDGSEREVKPKNDAETFVSWAFEFLNSGNLRERAAERIQAEVQAVVSAPDVPAARRTALMDLARRDIKEVLVKWQCLSAADLQEAWDLALVTGIMEA
jgi:hypothetical protein